jgi:simple sugar transport system ATP-binding protein
VNAEFEFINITKTFGEFVANKNVSFKVMPQTIHGVVGENGAGKSTILKIFYGLYQPDSGEIRLKNNPIKITSPEKAIQLGIGMVHQHFMLVPTLTVWENIILGKEPKW